MRHPHGLVGLHQGSAECQAVGEHGFIGRCSGSTELLRKLQRKKRGTTTAAPGGTRGALGKGDGQQTWPSGWPWVLPPEVAALLVFLGDGPGLAPSLAEPRPLLPAQVLISTLSPLPT